MSYWTDDRIELVRKFWNGGYSASQIAEKIGGCSRNAVIGLVHRRKLSVRSPAAHPRSTPGPRLVRPTAQRTYSARPPKAKHAPANFVAINHERKKAAKPGADYARLREIPVDVSCAKPWIERLFGQCAYIVEGSGADALACCQPSDERGYCPGHRAIMYQVDQPTMKSTLRIARIAA